MRRCMQGDGQIGAERLSDTCREIWAERCRDVDRCMQRDGQRCADVCADACMEMGRELHRSGQKHAEGLDIYVQIDGQVGAER